MALRGSWQPLGIIPSRAGLHVGLSGPVLLARLSDGTWVGHLDSQLGGEAADTEDRLSTLLARWECVRGVALPEDLSVALIKEVESQHGPQ